MSGTNWTTQDYLYVTAECVIGVLSVLGNVLVLVAIKANRSLRTITNCFIGSLAAADVLVGLIIPPTTILSYTGLPRNFYGCVMLNSLVVLITNISTLSLLAVAFERFLAVSKPLEYHRLMTINRALLVVAFTWIAAIVIGLIPVMGWHLTKKDFTQCAFIAVIDLKYMVYLIFFGMTVPLLLAMFFMYVYIFYIIHQNQQRMNNLLNQVMSKEMRNSLRQRRKEVRGAKGLAYVIILFAVCWLPIHIMNCVSVFAPDKAIPFQLLLVAIIVSHANSAVNPFLYAFSNTKFKYTIRRILCCGPDLPYDIEMTYDDRSISTREQTQQYAEELLNTRNLTSVDTVSLAISSVWSRTSAARLPKSNDTVCNGIHAGKGNTENGHLNPLHITDNICTEDIPVHIRQRSNLTVKFNTDIPDSPDYDCMHISSFESEQHQHLTSQKSNNDSISERKESGQKLWMTSSSKCLGKEQSQCLRKQNSDVYSTTEGNVDENSQCKAISGSGYVGLERQESKVDSISQNKKQEQRKIHNYSNHPKQGTKQATASGSSSLGSLGKINKCNSSVISVRL